MSDFVNLHVHGQRSELDGLTRTSQQIEAALANGQRAVAITDHGDCGAHFDVNKSALAAGLTPILGLEAYLSIGPRTERNVVRVPAEDDFDGGCDSDGATKEKRYEHLTLLAANPTGWRNLIAGYNASWDAANFFYKPRWDYDLLAAHSAGLIVGSGCLGGPVAGPLIRGDMDTARTPRNGRSSRAWSTWPANSTCPWLPRTTPTTQAHATPPPMTRGSRSGHPRAARRHW